MTHLQDDPYEYLSDVKFHQTSRLEDGRRISYATCGSQDREAPLILLLYGISGHRLHAAYHDGMLASKGLRMLMIDRPGIGGSDPVRREDRFDAYVESVLNLLKAQKVSKLTLVSQSSGLLYLIQLFMALPESITCTQVYAVSPFVPKADADSGVMRALGALPTFTIANLHTIIPSVSYSISTVSSVRRQIRSIVPFIEHETGDRLADWFTEQSYKASHERTYFGRYLSRAAQSLINTYVKYENLSGTSEDAVMFLEKEESLSTVWKYANFTKAIRSMDQKVRNRGAEATLSVIVYWGAQDGLVGPGGKQYLERALSEVATAGTGSITYERVDIPGGGHGDILNRDCVLGRIADELCLNNTNSGT